MASLHPQNAPQGMFEHKSCCSGCYTAPQWWRFSHPWGGCFRAHSWYTTGGDALLFVCHIFKTGVRRCLFEWRCAPMCRSSLMRHNLIRSVCSAFRTWSSVYRVDFPLLWRSITATWFSLRPYSMLMLWQRWANCLGTSTWRDSRPKTAILTTLLPHCLHISTTWKS